MPPQQKKHTTLIYLVNIFYKYGFLKTLNILKYIFEFWASFRLHIDVLNVSMRFNAVFCIYEHI